jgi:hypothetical protein
MIAFVARALVLLGLAVTACRSKAATPVPAWTLALQLPPLEGGHPSSITDLHPVPGGVVARAFTLLIRVDSDAERWRVDVPGLQAVAVGRCIAVVGPAVVRCLDPATGAEQWQLPLPELGKHEWVSLAADDKWLYVSSQDAVTAVPRTP